MQGGEGSCHGNTEMSQTWELKAQVESLVESETVDIFEEDVGTHGKCHFGQGDIGTDIHGLFQGADFAVIFPVAENLSVDFDGCIRRHRKKLAHVHIGFKGSSGRNNFADGSRLIEAVKSSIEQRVVWIIAN